MSLSAGYEGSILLRVCPLADPVKQIFLMAVPRDGGASGPLLLITHANHDDRFKLLDDSAVPTANLDNPIHPIFHKSNFTNATTEIYTNMQRSLQLASLFLHDDTVLTWFVAPLLGLELRDLESGKKYLSDPLGSKDESQKKALFQKVRTAMNCLAHCVRIRFFDTVTDIKYYARLTLDTRRPVHNNLICTPHFQPDTSVLIELRNQYSDFLARHYSTASLCERYRHDFSLAVTLVHEVCHAFGALRRGNLREPNLRLDHPSEPEFGFAWEYFMFGGILNPFDRISSKISFLMWKKWTDEKEVARVGKEWNAVPMSYIAQWFRKETWTKISKQGPSAVFTPRVSLKLRTTKTHYIMLTDDEAAIDHVQNVRRALAHLHKRGVKLSSSEMTVLMTKVSFTETELLQIPDPQAPSRFGSSRTFSLPFRDVSMVRSNTERKARPPPPPWSPRRTRSATRAATQSITELKRSADFDFPLYNYEAQSLSDILEHPPRKRVKR